jgi:hydrogenase nickel incorporation protein HypA/HybF
VHEYSIVQSLYDAVTAQAAARSAKAVHALHVRIGEMSGVDPGLLDTAWRTFRVKTICEDAALEIEIVPARWRCSVCGADLPPGAVLWCRDCGAPARLQQGDEIVLDSIVVEVP